MQPPPLVGARPDDEVSILDVTLVLLRGWRIVSGCILLAVVLSVGLMAILPRNYTYVSIIEIGRDGKEHLESADSVVAKLQQAYAPEIIESAGSTIAVDVSAPKGGGLVMLNSKRPISDSAEIRALHERIFERLAGDHQRRMQFLSQALEAESLELGRQVDAQNAAAGPSGMVAEEARNARQSAVSSLRLRKATISATRLAALAQRSSQPGGPGMAAVTILSGIFGCIMGMLIVFLRSALRARLPREANP